MRRRDFIALLGGTAAWPLMVRAQQGLIPVIGYLSPGSPGASANGVAAFERALTETGFFASRNVAIEYRWAEGRLDRLPQLASDLVRRQVTVLVANSTTAALATKAAATTTIPIVFTGVGGDPVHLGLVPSLNKPGGNITGVHVFEAAMEAKRLGLLRELVPGAPVIGVLLNPRNAVFETELNDVERGAVAVGQRIEVVKASSEQDIDAAFATFQQLRAAAVSVGADPLFITRREQIIALAARHSIPAFYARKEFVEAGGLASYGINSDEYQRWAGLYAGRILKGERPADLPIFQATKFEFVINLKTAKALGLSIPPTLLALADEVIE
jgi:putative tryptophan/tyrosine transport system substrate-binding protein